MFNFNLLFSRIPNLLQRVCSLYTTNRVCRSFNNNNSIDYFSGTEPVSGILYLPYKNKITQDWYKKK